MFDTLIENFPDMEQICCHYNWPNIRESCCKDSKPTGNTLTVAKARTVKSYLLAAQKDDHSSGGDNMGETGGFAVDIVKKAAAKKAKNSRRVTNIAQ